MMGEGMSGGMCKCPHHKFIPFLMLLFALLFLLGALDVFTPYFVSVSWPVLVGVGALMKLFEGGCKCCKMPMK